MKILLVSNKIKVYSLGYQNEVEPLLEAGHEILWAADFSSFVGNYKTDLPCEARQIDIRSNPLDKSNIKAYKQLLKIIREDKYDAVLCTTPIGGAVARLVAKKVKTPIVIYEAHGFLFFKGAPLINQTVYKLQEYIMSRWTDALVTINDEDYNAAKKMKLRKGGKLYMIHGAGVEVGQSNECDRTAIRQSIGLPQNATAIVSAGILNKNKNNHVIIKAMARIANENIYYVICGEGAEEANLKALAKKCGVENRVLFLGYRTDMKDIMCACDIFAMPSFREGVPRSLLEAMDLGLVCIGSETRGIRELIGNEKLLCSPKSEKEFAAAIEYVLENPDECQNIIRRNREEAKLYSKEIVRSEYTRIFNEVLR